jgi:signal transduction histidine kinase
MTDSLSTVGIRRLTPIQILLAVAAGLLLVLIGIVVLVANNNINATGRAFKQGYVLNDIVKVQRGILLLQVETNKLAANPSQVEFAMLDRERALLENQIRLAVSEADGNESVVNVLREIQRELVEFDGVVLNIKTDRSPENIETAVFELDDHLGKAEDHSQSLYIQEENLFFNNISSALATQNIYQTTLLAMSLLLVAICAALVVSLRNSVNIEFARAYRLLLAENQERKRADEALRRQNAYLEALHETTVGLISRLELEELLEALVSRAGQLTGAPFGFLYLGEAGAADIKLKVRVGFSEEQAGDTLHEGEGLAGRVWKSGEPIVIVDYDTWAGRSSEVAQGIAKAGVAVPLTRSVSVENPEKQTVGVLGLAHDKENDRIFGDEEIELLSRFAQLASVAIDNAKLFEEARNARALAELANEAKSAFLANLSHELRTPLNAIIGFTRIVKRKGTNTLPQKQLNNLDKVLISADHLLVLINTILDIAKIEAGHMDIQPTSFDILKLIELCMATSRPLLKPDVTIIQNINGEMPLIFSDQDKVKQILLNLLSNATKFTHEGTITISAIKDNNQIRVDISDSGIGIPDEDLPFIFDEFKQVNMESRRQYGGTGLGLSISLHLAHLLGGDLSAQSSLGIGSTFTLTLPIRYGRDDMTNQSAMNGRKGKEERKN